MTQNKAHLQLENKLKDFTVLQFEPMRILMQHRPTRRKFIYREVVNTELCKKFLEGVRGRKEAPEGLVDVETYTVADNEQLADKVGILYEYYVSDLEKELGGRIRTMTRMGKLQNTSYTEQELLNTFLPILSTLRKIHGWGQVHGGVRGRHIVITEDYQMKLCDAFLLNPSLSEMSLLSSTFYSPEFTIDRELTAENDLWAVGLVILESACLQLSEQLYRRRSSSIDLEGIEQRVREIQGLFSDEFVIGLRLLLHTNRNLRVKGLELLLDHIVPEIPEVEILRPNRSKPLRSDRNCDSQSPKKISSYNSTQRTFDKKDLANTVQDKVEIEPTLTPNTTKKQQKQNDGKPERVKIDLLKDKFKSRLNEDAQLKKKQIDKINKIIERSNAFVNELMVKKQEKSKMPSLNKTCGVPSVTIKIDNNENNTRADKLRDQFGMTQIRRKEQPMVYIKEQSSPIKQSPTKMRAQMVQSEKLRSLSKKK